MEQTSTNHSLLKNVDIDNENELNELITLLEDKNDDFKEVYDYLDSLKKDLDKEKVQKIIEYARQYRQKTNRRENAGIR